MELYAKYLKKDSGPQTPQECDYFFTSKEDFGSRIEQICTEHNNDLSEVTLGFDDNITDLSGTKNIGLFPYTLIKVPKMIFARKVTNFSNCFCSCNSLTEIQTGLFDKCTQVIDFYGCFRNCSNLTTIPAGLFNNCTQVTNFSECFQNCYSLTTIPTGFFDNCTQVTNFDGCFNWCTSIIIPETLFDNCTKVTDFSNCFNNCKYITSAIPDAWNKDKFPNVTSYRLYAYRCTQASNYADIPNDWKEI